MNGTDEQGRRTHPRSWMQWRVLVLAIAAGAGLVMSLVVSHSVYGFGVGAALGAASPDDPLLRVLRDAQRRDAANQAHAALTSATLLSERAAAIDGLWRDVERYYVDEVRPVERVLGIHRDDDPELVRQIAVALVRESNHVRVDPWLLLAVLLVENAALDPTAESASGARGLMQVMPSHLGHWPDCAPDLDDVDANICHGARIFAHYFRESRGDIERALLRYNGCSRGTVTPNCHEYPYHVFARAGRATAITWMQSLPPMGEVP